MFNPLDIIKLLMSLISSLAALFRDRMLKKAGSDEEKVKQLNKEKKDKAKAKAASDRVVLDTKFRKWLRSHYDKK